MKYYTLCLEKVPTFKLSVTLSNLNRYSKGLHCWKAYEICYKPMKIMQTNCILIASNFVIRPQILIFSVFDIASLSPYWLQIKFSMSLFFYLITFAINLWHWKFVTADVTAVFVNNQHGIQRQGQDSDKKFVFEGVHSKEINRRISKVGDSFAFSSISAEYLQKIWIFNFPR